VGWTARLLLGALLAGVLAWWATAPRGLGPDAVPEHEPDLANGERLFHAGSCASCHGTLEDGKPGGDSLGGGLELASPAGLFRVPNISPHPTDGIGGWTDLEFLNAMQRGLSPDGRHYYPSFPYPSYTRMTSIDLLDLKAWLDQMPAVPGSAQAHDLPFPFSLRRGIGAWKRLFLNDQPVKEVMAGDAVLERGRYLVEGPGHCGECHTPRGPLLALDRTRWLAGAPTADGEGRVPDISPAALDGWSEDDLVYYFETGVDPAYDVVGGHMVSVQENLARLPAADRSAIAAYLKYAGD
jgi:mono/diheme cytochrome c family protein